VLDHVGIEVGDFDRSRAFYEMALAPLGLSVVMEPTETMAGFGGADASRGSG
jgi:catechol 2,3-dioxygenase-like lactoylglutathione lyase family enzyme